MIGWLGVKGGMGWTREGEKECDAKLMMIVVLEP
jgi:hypothetical protein